MKIQRLLLAAAVVLAANAATPTVKPPASHATSLTPEQRVEHALNRLTFGARPGDTDAVRRMGLEKWIDLQLHPERIPENPILEQRTKPLETIRMDMTEVMSQYSQPMRLTTTRPPNLNEIFSQDQLRKVLNGTAEERRAALMALDAEKRASVLAVLPPNIFESLPDLQAEATAARRHQIDMLQMESRRLHPPLNDLLDSRQIQIATRGTREQKAALFASLDPDIRQKVAYALPPTALTGFPELRRSANLVRQPQMAAINDLREAKLFRAIYSNRQLEEVLVDFWFNHFNVFEGKGQDRQLVAAYERDAIRPHVFGKFKDLLLATARHPAMLIYLDNYMSMSPDIFELGPFAPGPGVNVQQLARQSRGINENYGRELMELHTLGVNGGYTQQDVINVARCFTGWTVRQPNQQPEFAFAAFMHDSKEKTVLGHKIPAGGGENDALQVIDILAHHPSTARFISTKLARHFVSDDPPKSLIDAMAATFTKTDGDLRAVLTTMFTSKEFFSTAAWNSKVKSPLEMVASSVRALGANVDDTFALVEKVANMGQPLYGKDAPTGYRDAADAWLSTAAVISRINFANALANAEIPGVSYDASQFTDMDHATMARAMLNHDLSPQTMAAIEKGLEGRPIVPSLVAALVMSSPEFQRR